MKQRNRKYVVGILFALLAPPHTTSEAAHSPDISFGEKNVTKRNIALFPVGSFLELSQDVNIRKVPNGKKLYIALKGERYQVLGVVTSKKGNRYYRVKSPRGMGYFFAGTPRTYRDWASQVWSFSGNKYLASPGEFVKVVRLEGVPLRFKPRGKMIASIPSGTQIRVHGLYQGKNNKLFYEVEYLSRRGFVALGNIESSARLTRKVEDF